MTSDDKSKTFTNLIQAERGRIVTNFAFIESILSTFIATHYFGNDNENFRRELLEDEYFGFALLLKVFEKILKAHYPEVHKNFPIGKIRRFQELRNIVAHATIVAQHNLSEPDKVQNVAFHRGGKNYEPNVIIAEYDKLTDDITDALKKLPNIKFGTLW